MSDIKSMFAKLSDKGGGDGEDHAAEAPKKTKAKPTIEKVYQKKTQLEHILLRPDTYIGSVEHVVEEMWVFDEESSGMVQKKIDYVPGLFKIFDEILVNAADNKQRDKSMDCIKIDINVETNTVSVWNNGQGIPVVMHKDEKMYVPTMIFGHLLTSSNYNDEEEKVTGGRNGYGAKLCNIFSTKFTVETASKEYKRQFKQTWADNMTKTSEPKIKEFFGDDFTKITFSPDLPKFKMDKLDAGIVSIMSRRAYDVAASTRGVKVFLNGKRLPVKSFKDYVELYVKGKEDETGNPLKVIYDSCDERWEVAMALSCDNGFQQMSFVNSIATTKGGRHVDYVADMLVKQLIEVIKKKNKGGTVIKPFQVKSHMWLFINCLIVNPTFDSQTKENLTLQVKNFGSKCSLSDKFITQVTKSGIVESVLSWAKHKEEVELKKKGAGKKQAKLKGIAKLEDANEAGTRNALKCTLILTEGDSAKSLAVSGLGVIGRDYYGVFPLRGKLLNVREATHKQILDNAEINNLIKILGLQYKKKYATVQDMETLRYGKVMIMTDQDQDGSHIKGLLINFIHYNWPELLRQNFLEEFITPIVKATKKREVISFYSLPEFEEWKTNTPNNHTYSIKYYKGLGTSTSQEAKEYFTNMARHRITFKYQGPQDDDHIVLAFSKKHIEQRKEWLTNFMVESKRRKELGLPERYLYMEDTKSITYTDFINLELVLFSNADNVRSIPSLVDGLKPGQRKVLFTCIKRNDKKEVKVAQLAGSVAEHSAYHHGEQSLCATIVNLAQNFVGSNNINLLEPRGQFGTRLTGGKDSASARYIFTKMSPLTRLIFHPHDDPLLKHEYDDNLKIEPVWYVPVIPMVLVNGAEGIGTGWMTKIANYNPREIVQNIRKLLDGEELVKMLPWYKNFKGTIEDYGDNRYVISGEIAVVGNDKVEITELPVGTWTQNYKENVLEILLHGPEDKPKTDKQKSDDKQKGQQKADDKQKSDKQKALIADYKEYNTDTTVKFVIKCLPGQLTNMENDGLHKVFKLQTVVTTGSMCAFDELGCLRRFESVMDILEEFYTLRLKTYQRRKEFLEGMLEAEAAKLSNQARFIMEKCSGALTVENKKRKTIVDELLRRGYAPDPVKEWKKAMLEEEDAPDEEGQEDEEEHEATSSKKKAPPADPEKAFKNLTEVVKFDYLLGMSMWMLTEERKNELLKQKDVKLHELEILKKKTKEDLWRADLDALMEKLDSVEEKERKDAEGVKPEKGKGLMGKKKITLRETMPSPLARRIAPTISDDIKKKIQLAVKTKENKVKRAVKKEILDDETDEFDAMVHSKRTLKDKLGTPEEAEKRGKTKKADGMKQTKLNFKKKSPEQANGTPKKKGRKKLTTDTDDSMEEDSDVEFVTEAAVTTERVARAKRVAATKRIKYGFSDEEEEFSNSEPELFENKDALNDDADQPKVIEMSSDDEIEKPPKRLESSEDLFDSLLASDKKTSPPANETETTAAEKRKRHAYNSDSDSDDFVPKKTTKMDTSDSEEKKKKPSKTKPKTDDSDDDLKQKKKKARKNDSDDEDFGASKPAKSKKKQQKSVSSDDEDFGVSKPAKGKKKQQKNVSSDDEDFAFSKPAKGKKKQQKSVSSDEDFAVSSKPTKGKKKPKNASDDDDFEPSKERTARAGRATKKPTSYVFDSDDESD